MGENSSADYPLARGTGNGHAEVVNRCVQTKTKMQGARVLILTGQHKGEEGICLDESDRLGLWAISPDHSDEILSLAFERDFGLLVDLSTNPELN